MNRTQSAIFILAVGGIGLAGILYNAVSLAVRGWSYDGLLKRRTFSDPGARIWMVIFYSVVAIVWVAMTWRMLTDNSKST